MKRVSFFLALLLGLGPASAQQAPTYPPPQPPTAVTVNNLPATQPVSGAVSVSNFPASQPVTAPAGVAVNNLTSQLYCPPVTGTLTSVGDSVQSTCMGAPAYEVVLTPNGATPLTGTIQASDPVSGVNRALFKAGVGELDVSNVPMFGTSATVSYRMVSLNGAKVTLTAATSGSENVTIYASYAAVGTFLNNPIHTAEEGALRNGRAYTASTSVQAVGAGNNLSVVLTNPAGNNLRLILTARVLACDVATGNTAPQYYGISNPTVNLPSNTATITNRRTGGVASASTVTYGVSTARPDTSPTTAQPVGGIVPTGGITFEIPGMRTVEPGTSFANWIGGKSTGLGAAMNCSLNLQWYEETIN